MRKLVLILIVVLLAAAILTFNLARRPSATASLSTNEAAGSAPTESNKKQAPKAAPAAPTYPPVGIAIGTDKGILLLTEAGRTLRYLTNGPDSDPVWSRDGQHLAFVRMTDEQKTIWVAKADGSDPWRLTTATGRDEMQPCWSPSGKEIAFLATPSAEGSIFIAPVSGGDERAVDPEEGNYNFLDWSPATSYDLLVYCKCPNDTNDEGADLYSLVGEIEYGYLTRGAATDIEPTFSPDGKHIAFFRDKTLCVMKKDGTELKKLLTVEPDAFPSPIAWSPKGDRLAFIRSLYSGEDGPADVSIMTVAADGTGLRRLCGLASEPTGLCWR